mmetsp:Transcript_13522/g.44052  ORF Transcript_13522/g.44052 Transcript_13522/m.44052 type:complete len:428 (-) Transcript_13522:966-2249(-)
MLCLQTYGGLLRRSQGAAVGVARALPEVGSGVEGSEDSLDVVDPGQRRGGGDVEVEAGDDVLSAAREGPVHRRLGRRRHGAEQLDFQKSLLAFLLVPPFRRDCAAEVVDLRGDGRRFRQWDGVLGGVGSLNTGPWKLRGEGRRIGEEVPSVVVAGGLVVVVLSPLLLEGQQEGDGVVGEPVDPGVVEARRATEEVIHLFFQGTILDDDDEVAGDDAVRRPRPEGDCGHQFLPDAAPRVVVVVVSFRRRDHAVQRVEKSSVALPLGVDPLPGVAKAEGDDGVAEGAVLSRRAVARGRDGAADGRVLVHWPRLEGPRSRGEGQSQGLDGHAGLDDGDGVRHSENAVHQPRLESPIPLLREERGGETPRRPGADDRVLLLQKAPYRRRRGISEPERPPPLVVRKVRVVARRDDQGSQFVRLRRRRRRTII